MSERRAPGARIVVVGATGNVGTSVVQALNDDPAVGSVLGLTRRLPEWTVPKAEWASADVFSDDLTGFFTGADAVIHLAWLFQPTHDPVTTWRNNVLGSIRVFDTAARTGVSSLVYSSSVGAYSPGPKGRAVDESWPTHGWPEAAYTREKAYLERYLDRFERDHPDMRVVRMRPGFIFKHESASEQRRLFAGPFLPNRLVRPSLIPVVPDVPGLVFQSLHTADAADAYRRAALGSARGAFNLAAEPVIKPSVLAELLGSRTVQVPVWPVRALVDTAWRLHLAPASPHLFNAVLQLPVMDTTRARDELGWSPSRSATEAIEEFLIGLREKGGMDTPPLDVPVQGGRVHELRTGVGRRP